MAVDAIQPAGEDAAAVWLVEDGDSLGAPLPSSDLVLFGRGGGTRRAGGTVAESLVGRSSTPKRVPWHALSSELKHQIRRGRRAARSSTSKESAYSP